MSVRFRTALLGVVGVTALTVSGCASSPSATEKPAAAGKGGVLNILNPSTFQTLDPQRNSESAVFGFSVRTTWRNLTTFRPGTGELVPDLATDTGTPAADGRSWTFTLAGDAKWQDGKPVTCEDVKYGISRSFATDQITGGASYARRMLDIAKDDKGASKYGGPYTKTGQDLFDKAVACDGQKITFTLKNPQFDFNQTLTTSAFVAYRADQDQGAKSSYALFSAGPYMLEGEWKTGAGGTFVRNPHWAASERDVRKAYPDKIVLKEAMSEDAPVQRIIADSGEDKTAMTQVPALPAQLPLILGNPKVKDRALFVNRTGVDFLMPNYKSAVMGKDAARQALSVATDRTAYAQALGGEELYQPTYSLLHHSLAASSKESPLGAPLGGDAAKAKAMLEQAGLTLPVTIKVAYKKTAAADKALAALAQGWEKAGFKVELDGISQNYYSVIASPASATKYDVFWSVWGPAWPSAATIIANTFDSRANLSASGSGLDSGYYDNAESNKRMDEIALIKDDAAREKAWGELSFEIAKQGGYVALAEQRAVMPVGSSVTLGKDPSRGILGQVDVAEIAVN